MSNFYPEPPPPPVQTSSSVRHSKPQEDWRIKATAIMTTAGGGVALLFGLINILAAFAMCITLVSGAYSLVVGALCLAPGIPMLSEPAYEQRPLYTTAVMQIK